MDYYLLLETETEIDLEDFCEKIQSIYVPGLYYRGVYSNKNIGSFILIQTDPNNDFNDSKVFSEVEYALKQINYRKPFTILGK
jgi:hypothetical protein